MIDRRHMLVGAAAAIVAAPALAASQDTPGVRWIPVAGGRHKVWTRKVGAGPVKVLLLHGGPGLSHDYLEAFTPFAQKAGLEIYYYDQLGCGLSDRPADAALWTLPRYLTEVEEVRRGLGLDRMVLYGHSWGGMLAIEYALKHPRRLKGLVLSNVTASAAEFGRAAARMRASLSVEDQAILARYEAENNTDNPTYQAVIEKLDVEHMCRLPQPWPAPLMRSLRAANPAVANQIQGSNAFGVTGNVKDWDRWADLPKIKTPTMVMGARYDQTDPEQSRREGRLIPHAKTWISDRGSHMTLWDDQDAYFAALIPFLQART